jgi:hypothetical protein
VVECARLEIGCPKRTEGSNPSLSVSVSRLSAIYKKLNQNI